METSYRLISTAAGWVGVVATPRGLRRVYLPEDRRETLRAQIRQAYPEARESRELLPALADDLLSYFAGQSVEFNVRFDWAGEPAFRQDVWRACARIGYGQRRSYGDLAEKVGRPGGARAVGAAMGQNPCPIVVPCHRVIKSDGSLGGYSGPLGVPFKQHLLEMEAAAARGVGAV